MMAAVIERAHLSIKDRSNYDLTVHFLKLKYRIDINTPETVEFA